MKFFRTLIINIFNFADELIPNSPKKESTDSEAIAPVTLNTITNKAIGATFGKTCENKIFICDPPVILAESTKGFTFT